MHNACTTTTTTTTAIRDVPTETRDELAARAAATGRSLQEYLRFTLVELADRPRAEAWVARARARVKEERSSLPGTLILELRDEGRR
jgi:plasmid stability protein